MGLGCNNFRLFFYLFGRGFKHRRKTAEPTLLRLRLWRLRLRRLRFRGHFVNRMARERTQHPFRHAPRRGFLRRGFGCGQRRRCVLRKRGFGLSQLRHDLRRAGRPHRRLPQRRRDRHRDALQDLLQKLDGLFRRLVQRHLVHELALLVQQVLGDQGRKVALRPRRHHLPDLVVPDRILGHRRPKVHHVPGERQRPRVSVDERRRGAHRLPPLRQLSQRLVPDRRLHREVLVGPRPLEINHQRRRVALLLLVPLRLVQHLLRVRSAQDVLRHLLAHLRRLRLLLFFFLLFFGGPVRRVHLHRHARPRDVQLVRFLLFLVFRLGIRSFGCCCRSVG